MSRPFQLRLPKSLVDRIDDWRFENGVKTRTTAFRELILMSLKRAESDKSDILRANWHAFCDCDPLTPDTMDRDFFIGQMEQAGLVRFRTATKRDVASDAFAAERGIEVGGGLWELTKAGRAALATGESSR